MKPFKFCIRGYTLYPVEMYFYFISKIILQLKVNLDFYPSVNYKNTKIKVIELDPTWKRSILPARINEKLTQVLKAVASLVQSSSVEFQSDNGEDEDSEEEEESDVDEGTDGLGNWAHHHLQTCRSQVWEMLVSIPWKMFPNDCFFIEQGKRPFRCNRKPV